MPLSQALFRPGRNGSWIVAATTIPDAEGTSVTTYDFRNPEFATNFDNDDYVALFQLLAACHVEIPKTRKIVAGADLQGTILSDVLRHIVYWADPWFLMPSNADSSRKETDLVLMAPKASSA
ncbi:hypothetical protein HRR83_004121 [Exophiala dermatitidis]|nr:hypothetical protein HRR73_007764 [Exophiala dermatitidis]KAJ4533343.1 hypothetical protein HRR77_008692 [Exophiala dermatitidis]KAJ4562741.1 hypothetical protein HRR81_008767 [Exophiala dermatitidis]KAJ4582043.1 hypothetical protein HRR82_003946 [Exophiala dermatitidis]KAJ4597975.1 hypothetical protein HRR83_004121 [Exophiala dermatitidis]